MEERSTAGRGGIDIRRESLVTFTEAAKRLPHRRGGKRPHVHTLYRWTSRGCRGVVLESIDVGGTRCTSVEALQRFFDELTQQRCADGGGALPCNAPPPQAGRPEVTTNVLKEAGILEEDPS